MTETFRAVEPLQTDEGHTLARLLSSGEVKLTPYSLTVAEARALRDWLDKALPCEHPGHAVGWSSSLQDQLCNACGARLP